MQKSDDAQSNNNAVQSPHSHDGAAQLRRVLLAEDEPDIRAIACLALHNLGGLEVAAFASGGELIAGARAACAAGTPPDLIVLDVMLPDIDGFETLRILRAESSTAAIAIVFLTARSHPTEIARYKAAGAADVVLKPFDPLTLADTLRAIWRGENARRET